MRSVPSLPARLERVEEAVRDLALTKDEHEALLHHLSGALDDRISQLEARLAGLADDAVSRRALAATAPADPARLAVVTPDELAAFRGADPETTVDDDIALDRLDVDQAEFVAVVRPADRLAAGWIDAAIAALDDHPDAVGAYGERIDVLPATDEPTLVARFEPRFDPTALDQSPCIDLSSVVIRRAALVDALDAAANPAEPAADRRAHSARAAGDVDGWAILRRLATAGPLVPVPVTASVGPLADPQGFHT